MIAGDRPGLSGWGQDSDPLLVLRDGADTVPAPVPSGDYGQFYAVMRDAIAHGSAPPVSVDEALLVMAIVTAAIESSATGRVVSMADILSR